LGRNWELKPCWIGFFRLHLGLAGISGDEKTSHLKRLGNAAGNLWIFKADLLDYRID
jgi:hypothetical protein